MRILCTGDMHIGRRPSRLPQGTDPEHHSAARCWERIVDLAIREDVSVVTLSGDVVDRDNRYAEAFGPLERGISRLCRHGIHVAAISGNHDHKVFAQLSQALSGDLFHFLGADSRWERVAIEVDGRPSLYIDGWSYPDVEARLNPLDSYDLPDPADGAPVIGLLHTALDQAGEPYAPVSLAELRETNVKIWLLGHFHQEMLHCDQGLPYVLYPSQPQAMQIRESGRHGVWIVDLTSSSSAPELRFVPMSSLRYDTVDVSLDGVKEPGDIMTRTISAIGTRAALVGDDAGPLELLMCRLRFIGRTPLHREMANYTRDLQDELDVPCGAFRAAVEKVVIETQPDRDLEALVSAGPRDPVSTLATLVMALDAGDIGGEVEDLVRLSRDTMRDIDGSAAYAGLLGSPEKESLRRSCDASGLLRKQAALLLDELLAQRGGDAT